MTGFAAALVEAWQELRIHRLRVLLSLIGVGVAVCSLTAAVAVGSIARQALVEQSEKQDGRPASFALYPYSNNGEPTSITKTRDGFAKTMRDFDITYYSVVGEASTKAVMAGKERRFRLRIVDPAYADMRRIIPIKGRWLSNEDAQNYSPAIVVNPKFLQRLGLTADSLPATVTLKADTDVTATIIGLVPKDGNYTSAAAAYMLPDPYDRWFGRTQPLQDAMYQMWVPPKGAKALGKAVAKSLQTNLPGVSLGLDRQDYQARGNDKSLKKVRYVVGGIGGLILLLGAMSLLNIALVTIKQRIREIGIRRSFGATTGRIFFSVMMESVVATFVAGVVGVVAAVGLVNSPFVSKHVINGVTDVPPFPVSAAVIGLLVSLAVGTLAGLLPALIAVRVRIIDAIRF